LDDQAANAEADADEQGLADDGMLGGGPMPSALSVLGSNSGGAAATASTKLIAKEYVRLVKLQARGLNEGLTVSLPIESDVYRWACEMRAPDGSGLAAELARFAARHQKPDAVQLEVLFTPAYPNEPPFVRILAPRFAFHTGHVTVGGSVCMELLTPSGWSPAYSLESVLVDIRATILTGNGRLDPERAHIQYDEREAREAFLRVARQHGWIKQ